MSVRAGTVAAAEPGEWWADEVTVRFGHRTALDGIGVRVVPGSISAVVGGDGAGKSTLLRVLAGVLRPDEGRVSIPVRRRIGYQSASSGTYPDLTVAENLQFAATAYGVPADVAAQRMRGLLERTGLAAVPRRLAGELSGGMRQKLGVLTALLHEPDLLVLDEPTTGVDPVSRADLWWLIARAAVGGCAVVLATTYLDEAERAARVLVLDDGRVLVSGTPDEVVAAVPGTVRATRLRPDASFAATGWRRGGGWHVWCRDGSGPGDVVQPDMQDAVVVAALARRGRDD